MEIILLESLHKIGKAGEIVSVKDVWISKNVWDLLIRFKVQSFKVHS